MNDFLVAILNGINSVIHNYGWSMVVFTLLIKLILLPLDYKSRKSMRRMTKLQPQIAKLQKKYANDKEKLNQKSAELYRKEGINPMSGCLPLLVSMAILWIMFAAMRTVANTEMASQALNMDYRHPGQRKLAVDQKHLDAGQSLQSRHRRQRQPAHDSRRHLGEGFCFA